MTTESNHEGYRDGAITGGLTTGIIGTSLGALGILGGGASLLGLNGNRQNQPQWVSKDEYEAGMKLATKDSEIALLKAERDDEKKMVEVYAALESKINSVKDKIAENRDRADDRLAASVEKLNCKIDFNKNMQDGINAHQLQYNGTNTATVACMQNQISQLMGMTKLIIPNSSCCPGWGNVTITPTTLSA